VVFGSIVAWLLRHGITSLKKMTEGFLRAPFSANNSGGCCNETPMLKTDLLPVLNAEASRLGVSPVTERMWEDWIEEDLIEGPRAKGRRRGENPLWEYPAGTTERALAILRLKADGVTRLSALRLQLWLHGHELPPTQIKENLESEFKRLLKKHFFRNPWGFDARDPNPVAPDKIRHHKSKLQPVDPTLAAAGLKPSDDSLLALGSKLIWGPDSKTDAYEMVVEELSQKCGVPTGSFEMLLAELKPYIACVAGLFGNPEEIEKSGVSELKKLSRDDLNHGRTLYQGLLGLFEVGHKILSLSESADAAALRLAFEKVAHSLKHQDWSVLCFALGALVSLRIRRDASHGGK
jgi:hypothetical protein